jgi:DNA-binding PadR family transcriptional regulator
MDQNALLLLGLLRHQNYHGYQLHEFIERDLSGLVNLKKATAYDLLKKLQAAGYIQSHSEQQGGRPPRRVYLITDKGRAYFQELLRENLAHSDQFNLAGDIGLIFLDELGPETARRYLRQRLDDLGARIEAFKSVPRHQQARGVTLAAERQLALLNADRAWLLALLERFGDG